MDSKWLQVKASLGFLVLVTFANGATNKGHAKLLDLEKEGEQFIKDLNASSLQGRIDSWGMTASYAYWAQTGQTKNMHPIISRVESLTCNKKIKSNRRGQPVSADTCEESLTWNIHDGLLTPFDLNVTVEIPMISSTRPKTKRKLNLNNQTRIHIKLQNKYKSGYVNRTTRICAFYAKATFNGYFAYHYLPKDKLKSPYYPLSITRLNNTMKALKKENGKLTFMMKGIYEEKLCRHTRQ